MVAPSAKPMPEFAQLKWWIVDDNHATKHGAKCKYSPWNHGHFIYNVMNTVKIVRGDKKEQPDQATVSSSVGSFLLSVLMYDCYNLHGAVDEGAEVGVG